MEEIKNIVERLIKKTGFSEDMVIEKIHDNWSRIAGQKLCSKTEPFKYNDGKLFVYADNSTVKSELGYIRREIIKKANLASGIDGVKEVVIRIKG
jgi:hypothetical protein